MARVQLVMPDGDRLLFMEEARKEGMSLSAWLRAAGRQRMEAQRKTGRFRSVEEFDAFIRQVHAIHGPNPGPEPDWEEHKQVINASRTRGLPEP